MESESDTGLILAAVALILSLLVIAVLVGYTVYKQWRKAQPLWLENLTFADNYIIFSILLCSASYHKFLQGDEEVILTDSNPTIENQEESSYIISNEQMTADTSERETVYEAPDEVIMATNKGGHGEGAKEATSDGAFKQT